MKARSLPQLQKGAAMDAVDQVALNPPNDFMSVALMSFGFKLTFGMQYTLNKKLSSGSFGTVWEGVHNHTNCVFAIKEIERYKLKQKDDDAVFREVDIMRSLSPHPRIINLVEFYEEAHIFRLVMELARGGDVFLRLSRRNFYTEKDARDLCRNLLHGVRHLHSHNICHRDLKPDNLLLSSETDDTGIKLADFGFSKRVQNAYTTNSLKTRCGTPSYVAPEVISGKTYNCKADMWSVGVMLYLFIGGHPPFQSNNMHGLFRKIRGADYVFGDKQWKNVSLEVKLLISHLLTVDPNDRLNVTQALNSSWMKAPSEVLSTSDLMSSITEMKEFNAKRTFKGAVHAVTCAVKAPFWNDNSPNQNITGKETFYQLYRLTHESKSGSSSRICDGVELSTDKKVAVKVISRKDLNPNDEAAILNEVSILRSVSNSQHIVKLLDYFEEKDNLYSVMELCNGGNVLGRLLARKRYSEEDARELSTILLRGVAYLHSQNIVHRDLKPENLMFKSLDTDVDIKISGFGLAIRTSSPHSLTKRCGTPSYVAPETLKNIPYGVAADMWSVGVIIHILLVGYAPFNSDCREDLFCKIRIGSFKFVDSHWNGISNDAKELIQKLLVVDHRRRLSAYEALQSKWICMSVKQEIQGFNEFYDKNRIESVINWTINCGEFGTETILV